MIQGLAIDLTAIAANTPNPDFTAFISQVADAAAQVSAIVQSFKSAAPLSARGRGGVDAVSDLGSATLRLKTFAAKK
jgi:hypothetical protein